MGESRGQMEARLKREGRWDAFEARRKALRAEGMTGSEVYEQVISEFAEPLPRIHDETDLPPPEVFEGKTATEREEVTWVAGALAVTDPRPEQAPSAAAWGLYQWVATAPENQDVFWNKLYLGRRDAPPKARLEPEELEEPEGDSDAELDALLASFSTEDLAEENAPD